MMVIIRSTSYESDMWNDFVHALGILSIYITIYEYSLDERDGIQLDLGYITPL